MRSVVGIKLPEVVVTQVEEARLDDFITCGHTIIQFSLVAEADQLALVTSLVYTFQLMYNLAKRACTIQ